MIALKREVAAGDQQVFRGANVKLGNWRQVTVPIKEAAKMQCKEQHQCVVLRTHTETCTVTACRTWFIKCEKEATFFTVSYTHLTLPTTERV